MPHRNELTMLVGVAILVGVVTCVSASPMLSDEADDMEASLPILIDAVKEMVAIDKNANQELLEVMRNIATTQEDIRRFLVGGAETTSKLDTTNTESPGATDTENPQANSNMVYFTRSVVAAISSGNNTQLDAILNELKKLNQKFNERYQSNGCSEGFISLGDECFNFQLEDLSWEESRQRCLRLGGDLAVPKNLTQVRLYINQNFPRKSRRNFWLGGKENNKVWEWLSGDAVDSNLWYTNEPSGNGECLAMFDGWERPLSDFPCENDRRAICEQATRS